MPFQTDACTTELRRPTDDIFKTSSGTGHHWRSPYYFPDECGQIAKGERIDVDPKKAYPYEFSTTYGQEYIPKAKVGDDKIHEPPPHFWELQGIMSLPDRPKFYAGRPGLSYLYKKSVTQTEFCAAKEPETRPKFDEHFCDTHKEVKLPRTQNDLVLKTDSDLLNLLDPYKSITHLTHSQIRPEELEPYKETIPRSWGFDRNDHNSNKKQNDPIVSKALKKEPPNPNSVRRLPHSVPHTGLRTVYMTSYENQQDSRMQEDYFTLRPHPEFRNYPALPTQTDFKLTEYQSMDRNKRNLL